MTVHTISQKMARAAYDRIAHRRPGKEYTSFAREFPALVHTCGLDQAIAFALAKQSHQAEYITDLATVLQAAGWASIANGGQLSENARTLPVTGYLRLSRNALAAAVWLKRYVETGEEG